MLMGISLFATAGYLVLGIGYVAIWLPFSLFFDLWDFGQSPIDLILKRIRRGKASSRT